MKALTGLSSAQFAQLLPALSDTYDATQLPDWSWYATGPCHGIQLRSGRLVTPGNHKVIKHKDGLADADRAHIIYSDDHGESWKLGGSVDNYTNESTVLETADGWLYLNSRNQYRSLENNIHFRRVTWSNDSGGNFSPSVRDDGLPEPRCQGNVCRYTLEEDGPAGRGKNRVLFSNPGNAEQGERLDLIVVRDSILVPRARPS